MGKPKNAASTKMLNDLLDLHTGLLIPFMKVRRDIPFPTEPERNETDGEHTFTLAMVALTLAEWLQLDVDTGLVAKYALVHDLVEAHAGDLSVRAPNNEHAVKADREHEAFLIIQRRYERSVPWIADLIEHYEKRQDEESKFVYATDKLMGALSWMAGDGVLWTRNYPDHDGKLYHQVVKRLRAKASVYPPLLPLFDHMHDLLDKERLRYSRSKQV